MLGTLVWDTIHGRDPSRGTPVEEWGGIAYALSAFELAGPSGWELYPLVKVGRDMRPAVHRLFRDLDRVGPLDGVRFVDAPTNRVELRYTDREHRTERLRGGVPGWSLEELEPLASTCDALYVNFIAGWELDLSAARRLAEIGAGPLYADLHSLFLETGPDGVRRRRRPERCGEWLGCFDLIQMNEDELRCLAGEGRDPWRAAARAVGSRPRVIFVTRGEQGVRWVPSDPDFRGLRMGEAEGPERAGDGTQRGKTGRARSSAGDVGVAGQPPPEVVDDPDPTGCGDAWGITCFGALLSGAGLRDAVRRANRVAGRNACHRGGTALARVSDGGAIVESGEGT